MAVLKHVGPLSSFKVGFAVYALLGLIAGVLCALMAFAGVPFFRAAHMPFGGAAMGLFAIILCPLVYGVGGAVATVITALLYNLASRWVGGLEVEIN
jgi:hypothetical protein